MTAQSKPARTVAMKSLKDLAPDASKAGLPPKPPAARDNMNPVNYHSPAVAVRPMQTSPGQKRKGPHTANATAVPSQSPTMNSGATATTFRGGFFLGNNENGNPINGSATYYNYQTGFNNGYRPNGQNGYRNSVNVSSNNRSQYYNGGYSTAHNEQTGYHMNSTAGNNDQAGYYNRVNHNTGNHDQTRYNSVYNPSAGLNEQTGYYNRANSNTNNGQTGHYNNFNGTSNNGQAGNHSRYNPSSSNNEQNGHYNTDNATNSNGGNPVNDRYSSDVSNAHKAAQKPQNLSQKPQTPKKSQKPPKMTNEDLACRELQMIHKKVIAGKTTLTAWDQKYITCHLKKDAVGVTSPMVDLVTEKVTNKRGDFAREIVHWAHKKQDDKLLEEAIVDTLYNFDAEAAFDEGLMDLDELSDLMDFQDTLGDLRKRRADAEPDHDDDGRETKRVKGTHTHGNSDPISAGTDSSDKE